MNTSHLHRILTWLCFAAPALTAMAQFDLTEADGKQWFKGQTHAHTLWSDGRSAPEVLTNWYKDNGYNFLVITDHNTLLQGERWYEIRADGNLKPKNVTQLIERHGGDWVQTRRHNDWTEMRLKTMAELKETFDEEGHFLVVQGQEITTGPHLNALNLQEQIPQLWRGTNPFIISEMTRSVQRQERKYGEPMLTVLNHFNHKPYQLINDILQAPEICFFEVFNGGQGINNWGIPELRLQSMDRMWDILLAFRLHENPDRILYGVGTDDAHDHLFHDPDSAAGRGWIQVLAEELSMESIIPAMKRGDFYSSSGVTLEQISWNGRKFVVKPVVDGDTSYTTLFYGTRKGFDKTSKPAVDDEGKEVSVVPRVYSDEIGVVLLETTAVPAVYEATGDELYIRAKVIASEEMTYPLEGSRAKPGARKQAWTQPVVPE